MNIEATAPTELALTGVSTADSNWRYALAYWGGTLANLVRPHRLAALARPSRRAAVSISDSRRDQWLRLFGVDAQVRAPLLTNQREGTLLYTQLFAEMRINFRHLLHLQHSVEHVAGAVACATASHQQLTCRVVDAKRVASDKAVITITTDIRRSPEQGGALLAVIHDRFLIRSLPAAELAEVDADPALQRVLKGLRRRRATLGVLSPGFQAESIALPNDLGRRYGQVSGDYNPVHTTTWAARLFGLKRPFAQGLALRNAVVARLAALGRDLGRFEITFASPAWLGQTLELRLSGGQFELVGSGGELVAYGEAGP